MNRIATIAIACLASSISALPARSHEHHDHFSAGEPGDSGKPSRTIEILMNEMDFAPANIEVRRDEQIRFVLRNVGTEDHEFLLATTKENLKHAELMKKFPKMEHDDPNGVRVAPQRSAEILWRFTKAGSFEYSCLIPNHRDMGMIGHVKVK